MNWYKWSYSNGRIRRYRKEHSKIIWENYPRHLYRNLSFTEIHTLIIKLNENFYKKEPESHEIRLFRKKLETEIVKTKGINNVLSILDKHVFGFFKETHINNWKKKEDDFGQYLIRTKLSASVIKSIIQITNRYIKFQHDKNPETIRLTRLSPVSRVVLKEIKFSSQKQRLKFINQEHYETILKNLKDKKIRACIVLGYSYGLRCSEILGLKQTDVFMDYLLIERQLTKINPIRYSLPKNKTNRKIPHWLIQPSETYSLINSLPKLHPHTLSKRFIKEMKSQGLDFKLHDLRRTWITTTLRHQHYRDVQLAAGHSNIETTQKYIQDDRTFSDKRFIP